MNCDVISEGKFVFVMGSFSAVAEFTSIVLAVEAGFSQTSQQLDKSELHYLNGQCSQRQEGKFALFFL